MAVAQVDPRMTAGQRGHGLEVGDQAGRVFRRGDRPAQLAGARLKGFGLGRPTSR